MHFNETAVHSCYIYLGRNDILTFKNVREISCQMIGDEQLLVCCVDVNYIFRTIILDWRIHKSILCICFKKTPKRYYLSNLIPETFVEYFP